MYNEYDDELEEGQFYEDPVVMNGSVVTIKSQPPEIKAAEEASKAAEEAAKAATEASKNLIKGMSGLGGNLMGSINNASKPKTETKQSGFGFGGLGGLFGAAEQPKKPAAAAKPVEKPPVKQEVKPVTKPQPKPEVKKAVAPVAKPMQPAQKPSVTPPKKFNLEDLKNKPFTAGLNARARWKWAYSRVKQVN